MGAPWVDHGFGGSILRRLEKRHTAAALVSAALPLVLLLAWVMLARTGSGEQVRAVTTAGVWYPVLGLVPVAAVLAAAALVQRGRHLLVWWTVAVVVVSPALFAGAAWWAGESSAEVADMFRIGALELLVVPLLAAASITGRDALLGTAAGAAAVLGFLALGAAGDRDVVWHGVAWLPVMAVALAGAEAQARRATLAVWAIALAVVVLPVTVALAALPAEGVDALGEVLWLGSAFLPAAGVLLAAAWRETTDPLAGAYAFSPDELRASLTFAAPPPDEPVGGAAVAADRTAGPHR